MALHDMPTKEVLSKLRSSESGLDEGEVQQRERKYGKNVLREFRKVSKFRILLRQFNSLLIYILILAAVISFIIGHALDAIVIGIIVILNSVFGFVQEYKAEEIIEKLKRSLQYKVVVLRGGAQKEIDPKFLVPGDIVLVNEGSKILADCRLIESDNLQINEAVLTGESFPVAKTDVVVGGGAVLAERKNMLYAGTSVVSGKAVAMVVETGGETEFGKLAELVQKTEDEKMPLEKKVDSFSKKIAIIVLFLVAFIFVLGLFVGIDKVDMFLISISLAVGAIPEGLPAIIVIILAIAIKKMYKVNTLIRRLPAAETLGRATVICTDKTGTLTEEELTVEKLYSGRLVNVGELKKLDNNFKQVLKIGILCNNARDETDKILGDPTETALIKVAKNFGFNKKIETEKNVKVEEYPFSSERKMMSIVRQSRKIKTSYVKGAPGVILERCTKELVRGKIAALTDKRREELSRTFRKMAGEGLRVLGFGFRQISKVSQEQAENNLVFSGFQGMIDPPRKEVKMAIKQAMDAGIKVKVLTGDSALTTRAISRKVGLFGEIIEGRELDRVPVDQWDSVVREKTIFARITPQQKLKIVEILKEQNEIVAVTGDGVNDILALKRADIGVAMGQRGSDVARDSSDIVLLDDNFASIVKAVKQGRMIFANLKKSIKFLLAANFGEVLVVICALIFRWPLVFLPLAILWMNLVTDSLPALALAAEPAEVSIMNQKPKEDGLLCGIWHWVFIAGILMVGVSLFVFNFGLRYNLEVARTMAITTAIFFELFFVFACKSEKSLFKTGIFNNKWLLWAVFISVVLQLVMVYTSVGSWAFEFVPLSVGQLGMSVGLGLAGLVFFEASKLTRRFFE
ncbi:ATPase [Candidatus Pacearchaeota archaeon]|nr:ATPase [Candidatus Pacearchaeota archaeon]